MKVYLNCLFVIEIGEILYFVNGNFWEYVFYSNCFDPINDI